MTQALLVRAQGGAEWACSPSGALMHRVRRIQVVWRESGGQRLEVPRLCVDYACGNGSVHAVLCRQPAPDSLLYDRCLGRSSPRKREGPQAWRTEARQRLGCEVG